MVMKRLVPILIPKPALSQPKRFFFQTRPEFTSLRFVDTQELIGGRTIPRGLSLRLPRIAKSLKFCQNFDKMFHLDLTPRRGFVRAVIPKGTVLRAIEYAFAMSFE